VDARARDRGAGRRVQARERPFGYAVGRVDGGCVGRFEHVLREDVDAAFARGGQVAEGVFGVGEAAGEADGEEGGVVVYYLRVGEGGEVGCRACGLGEEGGLVGCGGDGERGGGKVKYHPPISSR